MESEFHREWVELGLGSPREKGEKWALEEVAESAGLAEVGIKHSGGGDAGALDEGKGEGVDEGPCLVISMAEPVEGELAIRDPDRHDADDGVVEEIGDDLLSLDHRAGEVSVGFGENMISDDELFAEAKELLHELSSSRVVGVFFTSQSATLPG